MSALVLRDWDPLYATLTSPAPMLFSNASAFVSLSVSPDEMTQIRRLNRFQSRWATRRIISAV